MRGPLRLICRDEVSLRSLGGGAAASGFPLPALLFARRVDTARAEAPPDARPPLRKGLRGRRASTSAARGSGAMFPAEAGRVVVPPDRSGAGRRRAGGPRLHCAIAAARRHRHVSRAAGVCCPSRRRRRRRRRHPDTASEFAWGLRRWRHISPLSGRRPPSTWP